MADRRAEILTGKLSFPAQIMQLCNPSREEQISIEDMWRELWYNFLMEKPTDSWHIIEILGDNLFNKLVMHLSKAGWVTSSIDMNYASLKLNEEKLYKWVQPHELKDVRRQYKLKRYVMTNKENYNPHLVKTRKGYESTGIVRNGFNKVSNYSFYYDVDKVNKYREDIANNLTKGLHASCKDVSYKDIIQILIENYGKKWTPYNCGICYPDSRGRAIYNCMRKVFNPVGSKEARACLKLFTTCAEPLSPSGLENVYLFISELLGIKTKNIAEKAVLGQKAYEMKLMPEDDPKELYARIWLERIYDGLDRYNEDKDYIWDVPIECDATASACQFMAVLTNNHAIMDETNLINPEDLKDFWTVKGLPRLYVKKAITPQIYGSSQRPEVLWTKLGFSYTTEQLQIIRKEMQFGKYKALLDFKDYIIYNACMSPEMYVQIWDERFKIYCTKFKWEETTEEEHYVWHSAQSKLKLVTRTTHLVPDLQRFGLYTATCLVHNLDSQVCNKIADKADFWLLTNHDSFTAHPNNIDFIKNTYVDELYNIYLNREEILYNYFNSIGIKKEYGDVDNTEIDKFYTTCMK